MRLTGSFPTRKERSKVGKGVSDLTIWMYERLSRGYAELPKVKANANKKLIGSTDLI
jgi:hypothetical protein